MAGDSQAHAYLRQLKDLTESELKRKAEGSACSAGCAGAVVMLGIAFLIFEFLVWMLDEYLAALAFPSYLAYGYPVLVAVLVILAFRWSYYTNRGIQERYQQQALEYYVYHFRKVLFDEGLLAIVLADDPLTAIPEMGQVAGIPGSELLSRVRVSGGGDFEVRIKTLITYYGLICKHYRIEPYPADDPNVSWAVFPVKLKGMPYHAFVLALAEGVLGPGNSPFNSETS